MYYNEEKKKRKKARKKTRKASTYIGDCPSHRDVDLPLRGRVPNYSSLLLPRPQSWFPQEPISNGNHLEGCENLYWYGPSSVDHRRDGKKKKKSPSSMLKIPSSVPMPLMTAGIHCRTGLRSVVSLVHRYINSKTN